MGLDYRVDVAYGFYREDENGDDLIARLGFDGYFEGGPDYTTLTELGYNGLGIAQRDDNTSRGDWAVFTRASYHSLDPKYDGSSTVELDQEEPSAQALENLARLRDQLFPEADGPQPRIGWFLMSSVW